MALFLLLLLCAAISGAMTRQITGSILLNPNGKDSGNPDVYCHYSVLCAWNSFEEKKGLHCDLFSQSCHPSRDIGQECDSNKMCKLRICNPILGICLDAKTSAAVCRDSAQCPNDQICWRFDKFCRDKVWYCPKFLCAV